MLFKVECQQCGLQEKAPAVGGSNFMRTLQVQLPDGWTCEVMLAANLEPETLCTDCTASWAQWQKSARDGFTADQVNAITRRKKV